MTQKDIEKMLSEDIGLDMSHVKKDDVLAKAKQELYFNSTATDGQTERAEQAEEKKSFFSFFTKKRFIPIVAALACVFTLFAGMIGLYNENFQTIYIDVNPSVALKLNRFDRVIEVKLLNDDAKNLFANTDLVGYDVEDALETVISTCDSAGYVKEDSEIYISATSKQEKSSEKLLEKLKVRTEKMKPDKSESYSVTTYNTKEEEKARFENSSLSPAKDKIIHEIADADSDDEYEIENLKEKSMYELTHIKNRFQKHDKDDLDDKGDFDDKGGFDDKGDFDSDDKKFDGDDEKLDGDDERPAGNITANKNEQDKEIDKECGKEYGKETEEDLIINNQHGEHNNHRECDEDYDCDESCEDCENHEEAESCDESCEDCKAPNANKLPELDIDNNDEQKSPTLQNGKSPK